ncbi:glycoside hydrolase [Choiromyces venosus 120613-1]|uniref:Alpha-galactosidase n=1 Tax=Choiromyces venosus 120613-1 TaxID=1336337 RepID=A0A3N4J9Y7_9PEZI|nr:glycoside hydrolase [Choiromyces venosus 120613-1]
MANALASVDRDIVYSICQWGIGDNMAEWAGPIGSSWGISNDIINNWISVFRITNQIVPFAKYSAPGKYNDMDMLMVGNGGMTVEESKTHFTLWCIEKSLLFLGAGLERNLLDATSLEILKNMELVAINKAPLGEVAKLMRWYTEEQYDVWAGNLSNSRTIFIVANWGRTAKTITVDLPDAGIQSAGKTRDVWSKSDIGALDGRYTAEVTGHGVKVLILENTVAARSYKSLVFDSQSSTSGFGKVYAHTSSEYSYEVTTPARQSRQITVTAGNCKLRAPTVSGAQPTRFHPSHSLPAKTRS